MRNAPFAPTNPLYGPADLADPNRAITAFCLAIEEAKRLICELAHDSTPSNHRQYPPLKDRFPQLDSAFSAMEVLWRAARLPEKAPAYSYRGLSLPEQAFRLRIMSVYARAESEYQMAGPHMPAGRSSSAEAYRYFKAMNLSDFGWQPKSDAAWNHLEALGSFARAQKDKRAAK